MSYVVQLREEAVAEFTKAYTWYEEQLPGLGDAFETNVTGKLSRIANNPYHYKKSYKNYHEALLETFPFLIVYIIEEKLRSITVIAFIPAAILKRSIENFK